MNDGGGTTSGDGQLDGPPTVDAALVDLCTGYATTALPLTVPPGLAGLAPQLTLRYSSGTADQMNETIISKDSLSAPVGPDNMRTELQANYVGLGWTLDLGAIAVIDNQLTLIQNGASRPLYSSDGTTYHSHPDEYVRIMRRTDYPANQGNGHVWWQLYTKDGLQYRLGYNADSEQINAPGENPSGQSTAYQWNLDQIRDRHGNTIEISYLTDQAQTRNGETYDRAAYPEQIIYGGNSAQGLAHTRIIRFTYSDRADYRLQSVDEVYAQYVQIRKLDRIDMTVFNYAVRSYVFRYDYGTMWYSVTETPGNPQPMVPGSNKLLLMSVQQIGSDSSSVLPALTMTYWAGASNVDGSEQYRLQLRTLDYGYGGFVFLSYSTHRRTVGTSFACASAPLASRSIRTPAIHRSTVPTRTNRCPTTCPASSTIAATARWRSSMPPVTCSGVSFTRAIRSMA